MYVYTQWAISHRTPTQYAPTINRHLWQYYHGHRVVVTLPHRAVPCSVESREEWLPKSDCPSLHHQRTAAQSCGRLLSHHYSTKTPTNVTEDIEAHPLACQSPRCTNGSTGHVTKKYVISKELWMITSAQCFVYGDFSPTKASSWNLSSNKLEPDRLQHVPTSQPALPTSRILPPPSSHCACITAWKKSACVSKLFRFFFSFLKLFKSEMLKSGSV